MRPAVEFSNRRAVLGQSGKRRRVCDPVSPQRQETAFRPRKWSFLGRSQVRFMIPSATTTPAAVLDRSNKGQRGLDMLKERRENRIGIRSQRQRAVDNLSPERRARYEAGLESRVISAPDKVEFGFALGLRLKKFGENNKIGKILTNTSLTINGSCCFLNGNAFSGFKTSVVILQLRSQTSWPSQFRQTSFPPAFVNQTYSPSVIGEGELESLNPYK